MGLRHPVHNNMHDDDVVNNVCRFIIHMYISMCREAAVACLEIYISIYVCVHIYICIYLCVTSYVNNI